MSSALKFPSIHPKILLSDKQFDEIRSLFSSITGNKLGSDKRALVEGRLHKRLADCKLKVVDYIKFIKVNEDELSRFVSCLTTHKTDWFREPVHFDFLKRMISEQKNRDRDFLIWSAACSTGEEPYTILMALAEMNETRFKILGTDISKSCVESARSGLFDKRKVISQVRSDLIAKYFPRSDAKENYLRFNPIYDNYFKWRPLNLISFELPRHLCFDTIFLRNALIYFEQRECTEIVKRVTKHLRPGGFVIVGLSETIYHPDSLGLKRVANSIYEKVR